MTKFSTLSAEAKKSIFDLLYRSTEGFRDCATPETYENIQGLYDLSRKEIERTEIKFSKIFNPA